MLDFPLSRRGKRCAQLSEADRARYVAAVEILGVLGTARIVGVGRTQIVRTLAAQPVVIDAAARLVAFLPTVEGAAASAAWGKFCRWAGDQIAVGLRGEGR